MKKIKVMFDITLILKSYFNNAKYAGLYYVSMNILRQLLLQKDFEITLVYGLEYKFSKKIKIIKKNEFFKYFKYTCLNFTECLYYKAAIKEYFLKLSVLSFIKFFYNIYRYIFYKIYEFISEVLFNNHRILREDIIYFSPYNAIPGKIYKYKNIKKFIFLHDVIPLLDTIPNETNKLSKEVFKIIIDSINKETYIFCNSQYTMNDFMNIIKNNVDTKKMNVCFIASSNNFYPDYDKIKLNFILKKYKKEPIDNNYILSLCSMCPRKNVPFTVECFLKFISKNNIDDLFFFLAGAPSEMIKDGIRPILQNFPEYNNKIVILGYIQDEDINIILSNALFFVYLSKYEGFGMPPLEAMQAGTPVITSNSSSLPEVVGDAGVLVNCEDENTVIKAYGSLYFNEELRNQYRKKGLEQAKMFSWEKTISIINKVFYDTISQN